MPDRYRYPHGHLSRAPFLCHFCTMDLYKIVSQLSSQEFEELYNSFTVTKADKSAAFLKIIRKNPSSPDKEFIKEFEIGASAFYVLKSRLNQKVEAFLLNRVGAPETPVMQRVMNVSEMLHTNPREISMGALRKLERELIRYDFPYGLMTVYKEMQNLSVFDEENYEYYHKEYNRQVAYAIAMDKAVDMTMQFFRAFDNYVLGRNDKDLTTMVRIMEKLDNLNNLYQSHRIYVYKCLTHIIGKLFIEIPDSTRCEIEEPDVMFNKCFHILSEYQDDTFYQNVNILFNFLRFVDFQERGLNDKAKIIYEVLDYKIEELLTRYHFNANTSLFLSYKIAYHTQSKTLPALHKDVEQFIGNIEVETARVSFYYNYQMFLAYTAFLSREYRKASKILYHLRNEVNLRKYTHADLESKFFLALSYVMIEDYDLANQLALSLQRQLRKKQFEDRYDHTKHLLRVLNVSLGGRPRTKAKNLIANIQKWEEANVGRFAMLSLLDLKDTLLPDEPTKR